MSANVGTIDRILRILAGLALLVWAAFFNGPVWAWIGVLPFVTGVLGVCPAYSLLGVNTCGLKK
ncbi:MAG: YgaP family membrane protein [Thiobacillus sp.]